jgi:hypothetical protein
MELTYWSLDRKDEKGMEKAFVVFRQGQLISLNLEDVSQQRELGGNQIVSRAWVEQSTHTDPSNNSRHYYNNNEIGPLKYSFYAVGLRSIPVPVS